MKKLIFLISLLFIGCQSTDEYEDNNGIAYERAFVKYIGGEIHPLQDWGFEQTTRAVNPNSNEWTNVPPAITQSEIDKVRTLFIFEASNLQFDTPKKGTEFSASFSSK